MPRASRTDWTAIDWQRPNANIAAETGTSVWTVIERRCRHAPETVGKYRAPLRDKAAAAARMAHARALNPGSQPAATAAAKDSPLSGRGETNVHAVHWRIVSPEGEVFDIVNLHHFVRENPGLFSERDREWKRQGGARGVGGEWCNATAGLQNVRARKSKAWKGWTLTP